MTSRFVFALASLVLITIGSGCAARGVELPTGAGTALSDPAGLLAQAAVACGGLRTFVTELALAGRAGERRLRGRVHAGFASPDSMRLEGVAPFGPPAFILATDGAQTTLLLPRDPRVLRGERAEDVLGALTGVSLAPVDLQAILSGCVVPTPVARAASSYAGGWASVDLEGGARVFLRKRGEVWEVRSGIRGPWRVDYLTWQGRFPSRIRLRSFGDAVPVDLEATLSQVEANAGIDPAAFDVDVPVGAERMTLEELRALGPLGGAS